MIQNIHSSPPFSFRPYNKTIIPAVVQLNDNSAASTHLSHYCVVLGAAELHPTASVDHVQDIEAVVAERIQFGQDGEEQQRAGPAATIAGTERQRRRVARRRRAEQIFERAQDRRQAAVPGRHRRLRGHHQTVPAKGVHPVRQEYVHSQLAGQHRPAELYHPGRRIDRRFVDSRGRLDGRGEHGVIIIIIIFSFSYTVDRYNP